MVSIIADEAGDWSPLCALLSSARGPGKCFGRAGDRAQPALILTIIHIHYSEP